MKLHIVTLVRVLIGLPMATAYVYVRHFDDRWAAGLLAAGLMVLLAAMRHELSHYQLASPPRRQS